MAKTWQYETLWFGPDSTAADWDEYLNQRGADGWEVIAVTPVDSGHHVVLKRSMAYPIEE